MTSGIKTPSVQQLAGAPGPTIDALGRAWRLGFNDQDAKGCLEELVRSHHTRRAIREKRSIGGEEGETVWQEFCALKAAGFYDTFGKGWVATLQSAEGTLLFLQSLLMRHHPDITPALTQEIFATEPEQSLAAVEVVAPDFFRQAAVQKGYGTEDARRGGDAIAEAVAEKFRSARQATFEATPPEPVSVSATETT